MEFLDLPYEIRTWYLFKYFNYLTLRNFLQCSREYREIWKSPSFWKYLIHRDLSVEYVGPFGHEIYLNFYPTSTPSPTLRYIIGIDNIIHCVNSMTPILLKIIRYFPLFKVKYILGLVFYQFRITQLINLFVGQYRDHFIFQLYSMRTVSSRRSFMIKIRLSTESEIPQVIDCIRKYSELPISDEFFVRIFDRYFWSLSRRLFGTTLSSLVAPLSTLIEDLSLVREKERGIERERKREREVTKDGIRSLHYTNGGTDCELVICRTGKNLPISYLEMVSFLY